MEKVSGMNEVRTQKLQTKHRNVNIRGGPLFLFYFLIFTFYFCLSPVSAQEPDPLDIEPPPLRMLSKTERLQLDAQPEIKKRTKLALELMDLRVKKAEEFKISDEFDEMFKELGGFHALVDDKLRFLTRNDNDSGRILNNFKRFEIGLRGFRPRLELLRSDLPSRYDFYVRNLIKYLRDARTRAVEPFFSDTVVPNKKT